MISEGVSGGERGVSVGSGRSSYGFGSQGCGIALILNVTIIWNLNIFVTPILFVQGIRRGRCCCRDWRWPASAACA